MFDCDLLQSKKCICCILAATHQVDLVVCAQSAQMVLDAVIICMCVLILLVTSIVR